MRAIISLALFFYFSQHLVYAKGSMNQLKIELKEQSVDLKADPLITPLTHRIFLTWIRNTSTSTQLFRYEPFYISLRLQDSKKQLIQGRDRRAVMDMSLPPITEKSFTLLKPNEIQNLPRINIFKESQSGKFTLEFNSHQRYEHLPAGKYFVQVGISGLISDPSIANTVAKKTGALLPPDKLESEEFEINF